MKTRLKKSLLIGCALFLSGLFMGTSAVCGEEVGKKENGVVENNVFIRTASPAFRFPLPKHYRSQKPLFKEIFRSADPKMRLPITISIYELNAGREVAAEYEIVRKKVTGAIMSTGIFSKLDRRPVEEIAEFNGFPAYSFDFDCLLKNRQGTIRTNLLVIVKERKFISLLGMTMGNIGQIKAFFKTIDL